MSSSALRAGTWFRIFYRWTPLSAPQFINIAWILLRQYALFFVFGLVATVIAGAFLTYTIGLNAATLIIPLYVIGYAVCAEESARWMYAYQPFFSRSRTTTFAIALIAFEGTLRLFLNTKYIVAPLNAYQTILYVAAQYLVLEAVQIINSLIVIAWGALFGTKHVWAGFLICVVIHYSWNASIPFVGAWYLRMMNEMANALR